MAIAEVAPNCTLCGHEMSRLKRTTEKKHLAVFACAGESRRKACDADAARYGCRFT